MTIENPAQASASRSQTTDQPRGKEAHARRVERLFREHNESLLRYLRARLHSPEEAREVAQEAYVQLLRLDRPEAVSFLQAFLFRTADNLAKDRLKQRVRRHRVAQLVFFETAEPQDMLSPERLLEGSLDLAIIDRAMKQLPPNCRAAFQLVKFDNLSFDDAAKALGMHPRRVRRYVAQAIAHCMAVLDTEGLPGGRT